MAYFSAIAQNLKRLFAPPQNNLLETQRYPHHKWRLIVCIYVALAGGTMVVFAGITRHEFINYDDDEHIYDNPHVRSGLSWDNLKWAFGIHGPSQWHPLAWLSHQLDCQIFGSEPRAAGGHHLVSLLLHVGNVLLLFEALRRMTGDIWPSALVAALFGLHPLGVESVAWASERRDVLGALFWMLTLLAYLGYCRCGGVERYLLVVGCFALGLMSKPMLVTLPCVLLLLDYWPLRRFKKFADVSGTEDSQQSCCQRQSAVWLILEKLPLLGLSAVSCALTILCQRSADAISSLQKFPLGPRMANAVIAYGFYLRKMLWPSDLAVLYPYPTSPDIGTALGVASLVALMTVAVVWTIGRRPYLAVGWFWFLGMLVPVIGLVKVGSQAYADRFTYMPIIGIYLAIAWAGRNLVGRWSGARLPLSALAAAWIGVLMVLTWQQVGYWRDRRTLYEHTLQVAEANPIIHNNLGNALAKMGRRQEAIEHYQRVLQLNSDDSEAHNNWGNALAEMGKMPEAVEHYKRALQLKIDFPMAHANLGTALAAMGKLPEAVEHYKRALELESNNPKTHVYLGNALVAMGKLPEAVEHYKRALELENNNPKTHVTLGVALAAMGKIPEAANHFERALQLKSDYTEAHINLGNALAAMGRNREAIKHYERAIELKKDSFEAHNNLAWLLATREPKNGGNPVKAVAMAEQSCQATSYRKADALDTLAAAYGSVGRFSEAVATAQKAIQFARSNGQLRLAQDIEARLQLYKAGRQFRE